MSWHVKRTDVVEKAANAIFRALEQSVKEHQETVAQIRRDLRRERP